MRTYEGTGNDDHERDAASHHPESASGKTPCVKVAAMDGAFATCTEAISWR